MVHNAVGLGSRMVVLVGVGVWWWWSGGGVGGGGEMGPPGSAGQGQEGGGRSRLEQLVQLRE